MWVTEPVKKSEMTHELVTYINVKFDLRHVLEFRESRSVKYKKIHRSQST